MNFLLGLCLLGVVASLGHAMFSMTSGPDASAQMARALTVRVSLSVVMFLLMLAGMRFG